MVTGIIFDSDASHHALVVLLGLGAIEVVVDGDLQRGELFTSDPPPPE